MPLWLHIPLVILITVYFLYKFLKEKEIYQILFVIWAPITLLPVIIKNPQFSLIIGIIETVLFVLVIFFMFKKKSIKPANPQELNKVTHEAADDEQTITVEDKEEKQ